MRKRQRIRELLKHVDLLERDNARLLEQLVRQDVAYNIQQHLLAEMELKLEEANCVPNENK